MAIAVLPVPAVLCSFEGAKWLDWASQLRPKKKKKRGTGLPSNKDGTTSDLALLDHVGDDARSTAGLELTHQAVALGTWCELLIQAQAVDVRVGTCVGD
jgi:hypothetical protein